MSVNVNSIKISYLTLLCARLYIYIHTHCRAGLLGERARRAVKLNVSAPFHSSLMAPVAAEHGALYKALQACQWHRPTAPLLFNVDAAWHDNPAQFSSLLLRQVTEPVRWLQSMQRCLPAGRGRDLGNGVEEAVAFLELGPGSVLSDLGRQIVSSLASVQGKAGDVETKRKPTTVFLEVGTAHQVTALSSNLRTAFPH